MNQDVVAVLNKMLEIYKEKGWCQGANTRGRTGRMVSVTGRAAVAICLDGCRQLAEDQTGILDHPTEIIDLLNNAVGIRPRDFVGWNDVPGRTKAEVVAVIKKARKLAMEGVA